MSSGRAFLVYTTLRVLLLLVVAGVLFLLGARGLLLIVLAFLVSGALSLVLLNSSRMQASQGFGRLIGKINDRIDAAAAKEDPVDEESEPAPVDDAAKEPEAGSEAESDPESEARQQHG